MLDRRMFLGGMLASLAACGSAAKAETVQVYKTPTCGCCSAWVERVRSAGFTVRVEDLADVTPVARRLGVPDALRACHTAVVDGYFIEGHVPPGDIRKLLKQRPKAAGLAVPGMPLGSPGMEQVGREEAYATLIVSRDGRPGLFADHTG